MTPTQLSLQQTDGDTRVIRFENMNDVPGVMDQLSRMVDDGRLDPLTAGKASVVVAMKVVADANAEMARGREALERSRRVVPFWLLLWLGVAAVTLTMAAIAT